MVAKLKTIRRVAPEDLRVGQFVAVTAMFCQFLPADRDLRPSEVMDAARVRAIPADAGQPLRVEGVCLPFVLVRCPDGAAWTLDTRRHQITRLPKRFGKDAFRRMKPKGKRR